MYPYFKDCIGTLDGTLIPAKIPMSEQTPFRSRKGEISQNVFAACDFGLLFCYVLAGWEGSAHDARVLQSAIGGGFDIPAGKYYLGDAGYALRPGILVPFRGVRYHLREQLASHTRYVL